MIVTCPECSTSYTVPPVEIGIEGRRVKCKKCQHTWFHDGEKKVLDDLISRIQASDIDIDNIVFDDPKKKKSYKQTISLFQKIKNLIGRILKNYSISNGRVSFLNHFVAFMVALALFSGLCFIFVSQRWAIAQTIPSFAEVYRSSGFPLVAYANVNPEVVLIIEKANIQTANETRLIQANLINLSSGFVRVPSLNVSYFDENNVVVLENLQKLPIPMIQKEFSYGFTLPFPNDLPETAKTIRINFIN